MMRRKSTPSKNIYIKKNDYQTNISEFGRGKGVIPFFINEIKMYFVYMAL